jgi:hypothetical protein
MRTGLRSIGVALALTLGTTTVARAQDCSPPPELAGWHQRTQAVAQHRIGGDPAPELAIGSAVDLALAPAGDVLFAAPLGRPVAGGDHGGLARFTVALSGTYRIALGAGGWIDVVRAGKPVASIAHQHGQACTGIVKMVDFDLAPGPYLLQLSSVSAGSVLVMIVRLP